MRKSSSLILVIFAGIVFLGVFLFASGQETGKEKARQQQAIFDATFDEQMRNESIRQSLITFGIAFGIGFLVIYGGIVLKQKLAEPTKYRNGSMAGLTYANGLSVIRTNMTNPIPLVIDQNGKPYFPEGLPEGVVIAISQSEALAITALADQKNQQEQFRIRTLAEMATALAQTAGQSKVPAVSARIIQVPKQ